MIWVATEKKMWYDIQAFGNRRQACRWGSMPGSVAETLKLTVLCAWRMNV